jgi:hypothetical protein
MAVAVVVREQNYVHGRTSTRSTRAIKRLRVRRRSTSVFGRYFKPVAFLLSLMLVFAYVNVYAGLAVQGFNRSKLIEMCRREKLRNERLKVDYITYSRPNWVVSAAEKNGMVYAKEYDYITRPEVVASAAQHGSE